MRSYRYYVFFIMLTLLFGQFSLAKEKENVDIICLLSIDLEHLSKDNVQVSLILKNKTTESYRFLTWYTPFEGFYSDLFSIVGADGELLLYQGPMVKRLIPEDSDYMTIGPSESASIKLNLANVYSFQSGQYDISLKKRFKALPFCNEQKLTIKL